MQVGEKLLKLHLLRIGALEHEQDVTSGRGIGQRAHVPRKPDQGRRWLRAVGRVRWRLRSA